VEKSYSNDSKGRSDTQPTMVEQKYTDERRAFAEASGLEQDKVTDVIGGSGPPHCSE
jgi:hypothetical protein